MKATIKYLVNNTEKVLELANFKSVTKFASGLVEIKASEGLSDTDKSVSTMALTGIETNIRLPEDSLISVEITK